MGNTLITHPVDVWTLLYEPEVAVADMAHDLADAAIKQAVHIAGTATVTDVGSLYNRHVEIGFTDQDAINEARSYILRTVRAEEVKNVTCVQGERFDTLESILAWKHTTKSGRDVYPSIRLYKDTV